MTGDELLWAHHPLLFAIPAFVPALVIAGVVLYISVKDRRAEAAEAEQATAPEDPRHD